MTARLLLLGLVASLLAALPAAVPGAAPARIGAAEAAQHSGSEIISRAVSIPVDNVNDTSVPCLADGAAYRLRGRLIGSRDEVYGRSGARRMNVLVHDFSAGAWFWNLRRHPAFDYATGLAREGELVLVLDRLGYGGSPLADGNATCLGAQADMLHQVVQRVRAGNYTFVGAGRHPAHAAHVVLHGHSVGAAIAQLEAAEFDDVDGLVLMSWSDSHASSRAVREASEQGVACLDGRDYATYGGSPAEYRGLMFRTAPGVVQRTVTQLRSPDPCGDATSLGSAVLASGLAAREVDAPVLLLYGSRDVQLRSGAAAEQARAYAAHVEVTTRTFAGAANALPLEKAAPAVRRTVAGWLRGLR